MWLNLFVFTASDVSGNTGEGLKSHMVVYIRQNVINIQLSACDIAHLRHLDLNNASDKLSEIFTFVLYHVDIMQN